MLCVAHIRTLLKIDHPAAHQQDWSLFQTNQLAGSRIERVVRDAVDAFRLVAFEDTNLADTLLDHLTCQGRELLLAALHHLYALVPAVEPGRNILLPGVAVDVLPKSLNYAFGLCHSP